MTDEEIGKVMRCLLAWLSTEEEDETGGRGDILLWQMRDTLSKDLTEYQENAASQNFCG